MSGRRPARTRRSCGGSCPSSTHPPDPAPASPSCPDATRTSRRCPEVWSPRWGGGVGGAGGRPGGGGGGDPPPPPEASFDVRRQGSGDPRAAGKVAVHLGRLGRARARVLAARTGAVTRHQVRAPAVVVVRQSED